MTDVKDERTAGDHARTEWHPEQRCGAIEMGNGDVVIYDRERPTAWLQSDLAVSPEA